jgi:hypothetical protein
MAIRGYWNILIGIATLAAGAHAAYAADPCATFFWTGAQQAPVERYKPRYLIGEGLEEVHLDQIVGTRIRHQWSTQAASCIASSNHYGYFFHPDFNQTTCVAGESCFPGTRLKRMSERLTDVLSVAQQLATPNSDPTYQANLDAARVSSYLVIDAMGAAPITTASFYAGMVVAYDHFIDQLAAVLDDALPPNAHVAVMDALCSPDNATRMNGMMDGCLDRGEVCDLATLLSTIDMCDDYQSGAQLEQMMGQVAADHAGLTTERDQLAAEQDHILSLWSQIQGLHPSFASLPPTCNIHYSFGTAQLPVSDFSAGHYGADLRYLYGDWDWTTFGVNTSTIKATLYVQDIANLVHDCIGDVRYGRLDFKRRQVSTTGGGVRDETDSEYYARMTDGLVGVRAQFADVETNYATLLHTHAPLVPDSDINTLKTTLSNTLLHTLDVTSNRTTGLGWVLVLMQDFLDVSERFTQAQEDVRALVTSYQSQFPGVRDAVIQQLVDNVQNVLDEYGEFFSDDSKLNLEELMTEAIAEGDDDDVSQVIASINGIADDMQTEFNAVWDANQLLGLLSSKLKFIFGGCAPPTPHPLFTYFGDLPVTTRIVQEGNDAQFCKH